MNNLLFRNVWFKYVFFPHLLYFQLKSNLRQTLFYRCSNIYLWNISDLWKLVKHTDDVAAMLFRQTAATRWAREIYHHNRRTGQPLPGRKEKKKKLLDHLIIYYFAKKYQFLLKKMHLTKRSLYEVSKVKS